MSQQNAYENRVLNKTNFFLKKFGETSKKYPNQTKYTNWLTKKNVPKYLFSYETENGLKIRISKRQKNKPKVIEIKDFMVKLEGKEVSVDNIASFIAIYTIQDKQKIREVVSLPPITKNKEVEKKREVLNHEKDEEDDKDEEREIPDSWETLI